MGCSYHIYWTTLWSTKDYQVCIFVPPGNQFFILELTCSEICMHKLEILSFIFLSLGTLQSFQFLQLWLPGLRRWGVITEILRLEVSVLILHTSSLVWGTRVCVPNGPSSSTHRTPQFLIPNPVIPVDCILNAATFQKKDTSKIPQRGCTDKGTMPVDPRKNEKSPF